MKEFKSKPIKGLDNWDDDYSLKKVASIENASNLSKDKKFNDWSSKGGKKGIKKLTKWCEENNHWEKVGEINSRPKTEEEKEKISNTLKGRKLSDETKQKMSESRMGHSWSDTAIDNMKKSARKRCVPILQYDLNGNFIKEWQGFAFIVDELGLEKSGIYSCCAGKIKKSQGFIWKYKKDFVSL